MERKGTTTKPDQARVAVETISQIMAGTLFGAPPGSLKSKQDKPDTAHGWPTAQAFAAGGVPYATSSTGGPQAQEAVEVIDGGEREVDRRRLPRVTRMRSSPA